MRDEDKAAHDYTETWCKSGEVGYVEVSDGARVRYLRVGSGPPLVLMHTVRTQLDHFQRVVPLITDAYTVYALDFPGMGWSDIVPGASYDEPALRAAVVRVVEDLDLSDLTLAGESMERQPCRLRRPWTSASESSASSPSTTYDVRTTAFVASQSCRGPRIARPTSSVPGARDIVLRDTGHFAALEAPDDWTRILLDDDTP